jgi:hypothetical protein
MSSDQPDSVSTLTLSEEEGAVKVQYDDPMIEVVVLVPFNKAFDLDATFTMKTDDVAPFPRRKRITIHDYHMEDLVKGIPDDAAERGGLTVTRDGDVRIFSGEKIRLRVGTQSGMDFRKFKPERIA